MSRDFNLIEYLPMYYHHSPQMTEIQKAIGFDIPDVEEELWKAYFLSLASDYSLDLWVKELGVDTNGKDKDEIVAELLSKLNVKEPMTRGFIKSMGYGLIEPWIDMATHPEKYLDKERHILTSIFVTDYDNLEQLKGIIKTMGCVGFQYFIQLALPEILEADNVDCMNSFSIVNYAKLIVDDVNAISDITSFVNEYLNVGVVTKDVLSMLLQNYGVCDESESQMYNAIVFSSTNNEYMFDDYLSGAKGYECICVLTLTND